MMNVSLEETSKLISHLSQHGRHAVLDMVEIAPSRSSAKIVPAVPASEEHVDGFERADFEHEFIETDSHLLFS